MNLERLFRDYKITYAGPGDRHYRGGWINLPCPFCQGNQGNHLGYSASYDYFACHRCGGHSTLRVIAKLFGLSYGKAKELINRYPGRGKNRKMKVEVSRSPFKFPDDLKPITQSREAMRYMLTRGFSRMDIAWLQKRYLLQATGEEGLFKDMDLSYRILAPITHYYDIVSWQTRDYTGHAGIPYITCPEETEIKHHKEILYCPPDALDQSIIVICEGIMDVWKVALAGFPATCCFGVKYKPAQLRMLMEYEKVIIYFDPDIAGIKAARKIRRQLLFAGVKVGTIKGHKKDAGATTKKRVVKILNSFMKITA